MTGPQFDPQPGDTCSSGITVWTVTARNGDTLTYEFAADSPGSHTFPGQDMLVTDWADDFDGYYKFDRPAPTP